MISPTARGKRRKENRELISTELDKSMLVEAAAGTGKTTELVGRIVALLRNKRATIREIVAVTFSEKAAGELKLRLREDLERARTREANDAGAHALLEQAIIDFEEAHVSTIHGFCSELLRERPVEARVDPAFTVLTDSQAERLFEEAFMSWIHEQLAAPDEGVRRSLRRPVRRRWDDEDEDGPIERLRRAARDLREWRDHDAPWSRPSYDRIADIKRLIAQLREFAALTAKPINRGDNFAIDTRLARTVSGDIERQRRSVGDMVPESVYDSWEAALVGLADNWKFARPRKGSGSAFALGVTRQQAHDAHAHLLAGLAQFRADANADIAALLHEEMQECSARYERRKQEAGALDFLDLLLKARDLVRDNAEVRKEFRERFRVILVDEFQDTDPVQADLLNLLTEAESGALRPGALFIVGDPKQSIYRFRRADVGAYRRISERLKKKDALEVTLQTSFRSVPAIQHFVNAAFSLEMNGDPAALQADYVALMAARQDVADQPAVIALPVPRPYGFRYGRPEITQAALAASQPTAIAEFVAWLLSDTCTWTVEEAGVRRRIQASDICLLFRRFVHYRDDITRSYVDALEARGIPHLLVGGKTFHEREEVDAIRTALTAIEWPEDELSVYAALHGPLFAIGEEELLEYHSIARVFHPYRIPLDLPDRLAPIGSALKMLRELHAARNHRPVSDTIGRLIARTRAHAGFVLWQGGEQVLANVLQISDLARRYDVEGGLSFRGFVDLLRDTSKRAEAPEAPILEPGTEGVRLMTVHKAKGLEFPVVVLADIGCKLSRDDASRYLDTDRRLCAFRMGEWSPRDLIEHNEQEAKRDEAEGVRLAYVAATRARDILVVPAIGDGPYQEGWLRPLNQGLYPPRDGRQSPSSARGVPLFKGKDTVLPDGRADGQQPDESTVRPGAYTLIEPLSAAEYTVVWWDPLLLDAPPKNTRGLRREDLISLNANPADVARDRARYDAWRDKRERAQVAGAIPSATAKTATEIIKQANQAPGAIPDVAVEDAGAFIEARPSGKRFGTLVHALLATLPLDVSPSEVVELAALHAKLFAASDAERDAAAEIAVTLIKHARWQAARAAAAQGRRVWREVPVSMLMPAEPGAPPTIVDGQVDLAYETENGWVVIDFKTDIEIVSAQDAYKQQVALYAEAVAKATGQPATGVLLRV
ncbi:MAG TPA: UvrD-helicase domain-containing protein [Vicinamibacterales bacterium]